NEILDSQRQMLQNMDLQSGIDDDRMARLFGKEIVRFRNWIAQSNHINCLEVPYNDIAAGSTEPINHINAHLGGALNTSAMASIVDPSLYRNRAATQAA
ncbi:MAG: sulfotransferase family protein, partial [Fuerstiella sp.]